MSVWGRLFRVSTFGESHGAAVGCVIDGVPPGVKLDVAEDVQPQMNRRRPGQSSLTTQRDELDKVHILSGTEQGVTIGTPIGLMVHNQDQRKFDYAETSKIPRPGHADLTYHMKYNGHVAKSGGGRSSARETLARVAAGAVAEKWLSTAYNTSVVSWVSAVQDISVPPTVRTQLETTPPTREEIDMWGTLSKTRNGCYIDYAGVMYDGTTAMPLTCNVDRSEDQWKVDVGNIATRCPHPPTAVRIALRIGDLRSRGDTTGGIVTTVVTRVPVALGEPVFDKVEAELAKAMMSLPATKGFEIGEGFKGTEMTGSQHNDRFVGSASGLRTLSNHAGGTLGGITTGENLVFRVAFKPVSSLGQSQTTADYDGASVELAMKGRHDPCVLPRAPPLVEGMTALVLADLALMQRARQDTTPLKVY